MRRRTGVATVAARGRRSARLRESLLVHSHRLHASLHDYAEQVGAALSAAVAAGAEVGFEVTQEGGRGSAPALYCYQPLTTDFIESHGRELSDLPAHGAAVHALAALDNLGAYADSTARGQRELAAAALGRFIARVFAEGDFALTPERFEPAYREIEGVLVEGRTEAVLLCLLRGITTESPEVALSEGVALAPPSCLEHLPPDPFWLGGSEPSLVVAIAVGSDGIAMALARARELLSAMRLFARGIACEPIGWLRGESGTWRAVAIGTGGCGDADGALAIAPQQEDELRAFCNLIARRRPAVGELAWALERFEFGLDREDPLAGLTDHLLALRVLLEPEGPRSGRLAGRLAVLCAVQDRQADLAEHVARAISLEAALISGARDLGPDAAGLAFELEAHLRALLRDVLCGHLPSELVSLADELLLGSRPEPLGQDLSDAAEQGVTDEFDLLSADGVHTPWVQAKVADEEFDHVAAGDDFFEDEPAHGEVPVLPLVR